MIPYVLLAQTDPSRVGVGKIIGGWEFVTAAYVLTLLGIVLYAASLWVRRRKE